MLLFSAKLSVNLSMIEMEDLQEKCTGSPLQPLGKIQSQLSPGQFPVHQSIIENHHLLLM